MPLFLTYLLAPGAFIGIPILDKICQIRSDRWLPCVRDYGSGTSTGEFYFSLLGSVVLYGSTIIILILSMRKKVKKYIA